MPFFQGAYDFDISGPVQMNDGSAVGHVTGTGRDPGQATQHVQPQQAQSIPTHQPAPQLAHPQVAFAPAPASPPPANAVYPASAPILIPIQQGAQPQYVFPGNPQPYILVYASVPTQGGILAPAQAGYLTQPPQLHGLPYYLVPQGGGYQPASYLAPTPAPTSPDSRSLNTSTSPSINSERGQQGLTAVSSPPLMYTSTVPVNGFPLNGSAHVPAPSPAPGAASYTPSTLMPNNSPIPGAPLSSNGTNHSATSVVTPPVPATYASSPGSMASSPMGVYSLPGQGPNLAPMPNAVPQPPLLPIMQPVAMPSPALQVVSAAAEQASNQPKRKRKSWLSRVFKKESSKKSTS